MRACVQLLETCQTGYSCGQHQHRALKNTYRWRLFEAIDEEHVGSREREHKRTERIIKEKKVTLFFQCPPWRWLFPSFYYFFFSSHYTFPSFDHYFFPHQSNLIPSRESSTFMFKFLNKLTWFCWNINKTKCKNKYKIIWNKSMLIFICKS